VEGEDEEEEEEEEGEGIRLNPLMKADVEDVEKADVEKADMGVEEV
jgi:hypothetical protein